MLERVQNLIHKDDKCKTIIQIVLNNPYIELKDVYKDLGEENLADYDKALETLIDENIILELTSQAGSSIESRVPKKILIINPEISDQLEI
ncbi:hypothetical protein [Siminovitchia sp. 179-K 8D1 HS]|uniref:hypothetical protein n=1 Tax=Siminovitchia sp. 179-K 8D1 HS TaxID=3142385 RepID=UPI0039A311F8